MLYDTINKIAMLYDTIKIAMLYDTINKIAMLYDTVRCSMCRDGMTVFYINVVRQGRKGRFAAERSKILDKSRVLSSSQSQLDTTLRDSIAESCWSVGFHHRSLSCLRNHRAP